VLYCSINGLQVNLLSVKNRGLNYGDGLFTTAKIFNGEIEMLDHHLQRLEDGCAWLNIPMVSLSELTQELKAVALPHLKAVIKIVITAGEGGRGYSRIGISPPSVIINISSFPEHYDYWQTKGINLGISQLQLGVNPMLGGLKHLNRLEQVLIRQELDQRDEDDLLVTNIDGYVVESSCANVFWLIDGKLNTPKISSSGIAGLMRAKILAKMPETIIKDFTINDLEQVQAMFICNSVMGIVPIEIFNGKRLSLDKVNSFKCL
jgi:4-amino-4-deoxychorismate lyase